jgi:prepilin-type N-terminal cleavage/methylation domain-containing protein
MTSRIGNPLNLRRKKTHRAGLTFIEVMVAVAVIAAGITAIYRSYILAIERMGYLNRRLYATMLLDDRLMRVERFLRVYKALPMNNDLRERVYADGEQPEFAEYIQFHEIEGLPEIFQVDLRINWKENQRDVIMRRSAYISDFCYSNPWGVNNSPKFKRSY